MTLNPQIKGSGSTADASLTPLTVAQAAILCGCSSSFLNQLRVSGGGPAFVKLGRKVVYEPAELRTWLNSRRRTSTSQLEAA